MGLICSARAVALASCAAFAITATAGCELVIGTKFEFQCPQPAGPRLAIAVGGRANAPTPKLPMEARQAIADAMTSCARITVIRIDGRPAVVGTRTFGSTARTEQNFQIEQSEFLAKTVELVNGARAQVAEANVLGALSLASSAAGPGGTVVLIDSGIQTTSPIDLRTGGLTEKKPTAIAKALQRERLLPDLTDQSIILAGLGYTAPPQAALDDRSRQFVVDLWREIVTASGARNPLVVAEPNTDAAPVTSPTVGRVDFPVGVIDLSCQALSVLPDDGKVGFIPDRAELRDPAAARTVLNRFADFLRANPEATVEIKGYVAHYGAGDLSQRRADRVRQELVSLGVRNQMKATGMGWGPYPHPTAPPNPRYDQLNRRVTIAIACG